MIWKQRSEPYRLVKNMKIHADLSRALDDLVVDLNSQWRLHRELFQEHSHYPLFIESGPIAWRILRDALMESVFMSVARLLDPAGSGKKKNLSFAQVLKAMPESVAKAQIVKDHEQITVLYKAALKDWRNWKLSHNNFETITRACPLPEIQFTDVESLIDRINKLAQSLAHAIQNSHSTYGTPIPSQHWVWAMVEALKFGVKHRRKGEKPQRKS